MSCGVGDAEALAIERLVSTIRNSRLSLFTDSTPKLNLRALGEVVK